MFAFAPSEHRMASIVAEEKTDQGQRVQAALQLWRGVVPWRSVSADGVRVSSGPTIERQSALAPSHREASRLQGATHPWQTPRRTILPQSSFPYNLRPVDKLTVSGS